MGANGIETDVRRTKDGVLVLFHDDTLGRVTAEAGSLSDYTYEELQNFFVKKGELRDKIPTFEDFLVHFKSFDLTFAIELKDGEIEERVVDLIHKYGLESKVVVTSFNLEYLKKVIHYAPRLRIGYLTTRTDEAVAEELLQMGAYEICPMGETVTEELVRYWHGLGLNVRAWGISNVDIMKKVYDAGVDGMTVNFPDALVEYIEISK